MSQAKTGAADTTTIAIAATSVAAQPDAAPAGAVPTTAPMPAPAVEAPVAVESPVAQPAVPAAPTPAADPPVVVAAAKKTLVCFFVFGTEGANATLVNKCVQTVRDNASDPDAVDFVAVCDEAFERAAAEPLQARVVRTPSNADPREAAKRKLQLFELVPNLSADYRAVVWMDPATVVCSDIARLFSACTAYDKLYVFPEPGRDTMDSLTYGLCKYTMKDKLFFAFNNVYGFGTHQAMFRPTDVIKAQFERALAVVDSHDGPHEGDTSFLNHHFLSNQAKHLDRTTLVRFFFHGHGKTEFVPELPFIVSFPGADKFVAAKIKLQQRYYEQFLEAAKRHAAAALAAGTCTSMQRECPQ